MNTMFYVWLITALLFLIFEIGSPGLFYFLSFAFGAALSGVSSIYVDSVIVQSLIFLAGSIVALGVLQWFVQKHEQPSKKSHTNIYALQGKKGVVLVAVEPNKLGQIKVGGEQWAARAHGDEVIEVGTEIEIVCVGGAHVVVKRVTK